jgi:hypothetical protein
MAFKYFDNYNCRIGLTALTDSIGLFTNQHKPSRAHVASLGATTVSKVSVCELAFAT